MTETNSDAWDTWPLSGKAMLAVALWTALTYLLCRLFVGVEAAEVFLVLTSGWGALGLGVALEDYDGHNISCGPVEQFVWMCLPVLFAAAMGFLVITPFVRTVERVRTVFVCARRRLCVPS